MIIHTDSDGDYFEVVDGTDDTVAHLTARSPYAKESLTVNLPDAGPQRDAMVKAFADAMGVRIKFR